MAPIVTCENLVRIYKTDETEVLALQGLDLTIEEGEIVAIIGASGSGKSTFLNILGGLDRPSAGKLYVDGLDMMKLTNREMLLYKRNKVSFIWQNSARNLLPYLTAMENIVLPMEIVGKKPDYKKAARLLEMVGIADKADSKLFTLSGGEQQRTALAKVMLTEPKILLLDEPTKGMDSFFKQKFARVLKRLQTEGVTVVMVSHDVEFCARYADLTGMFFDGSIVTVNTPEKFFARNSFYTTAANRMSRHIFQNAVNVEDVIELCRKNR